MAYDIRVRGLRDTITSEKDDAVRALIAQWELLQNKRGADALVHIGSWIGMLSQIVSFSYINVNTHQAPDYKSEWINTHANLRSMTPEQKAQNAIGLFRIMYWGFNKGGKSEECTFEGRPADDVASERMVEFFNENPLRIFPDPKIFRDMFGHSCNMVALPVIENIINADMREVHFAKK